VPAIPGPSAELLLLSATEIAALVRRREVSASEVIARHLDRVEEVNGTINAIVTLAADSARRQALELDRRLAAGDAPGPLAGVPFTVKDVIATEGLRTTAGTAALRDYVPPQSAPAVKRLAVADAILLGKSNCPEFALDHHTSNLIFGDTWNPLDTAFTSGGSSGGDSAAVTSGCAAFGVGTDYGGSIRWPAHCTGLAAIRQTPGLVPGTGMLPYACGNPAAPPNSVSLQWRLQVIAPLARTTGDLYEVVRAMAGPDDRDPYAVPVDIRSPGGADTAALTVAWFEDDGSYPVRADLRAAIRRAATALHTEGLEVEQRRPPGFEQAESIFHRLRTADGLDDQQALVDGQLSEVTPVIAEWLEARTEVSVGEYRRIATEADVLRADVLAFMRRWKILLLPVASIPAFKPGARSFAVDGVEIPWIKTLACCRAVSLLALPAAVVRFGTSDEGLPIGVQIVGRPFCDHEVLAIAALLEDDWTREREKAATALEALRR
jgi:Asp-tRNA(Asn)/Glu-tRNA(Gln) amidotransferase A subunit family amidase